MECAPSYVAGALLRGDQRRRPIPASILLNTICVDDPRIPTLGIGGFLYTKKRRISTTLLSCSEDEAREYYSIICCTFSFC